MVDTPRTPLSSPVLVGRERELEQLAQAWRAAHQGRGQFVVVSGDAGVGKSRLLAEFRTSVQQHPIAVVTGSCFEADASFPYALLIDALRALFIHWTDAEIRAAIGSTASELAKLLPELAHAIPGLAPTPPLDPEAEKRHLFEILAHFLLGLATWRGGSQPLLVLLEDLHWSDATSLDFLHFFARRLTDFPILVLVSYRREELPARLAHLLTHLDRERRAEEIVLKPLGRDGVATMVQAFFNIQRPIKADFLDLVLPLSEGNPFFIEEILKALVQAGDIFYAEGRWERKPAPELHVPRSVQDAVQRRLEHVSPAAREVATLAAVAGQRFDFVLLQELTAIDEHELLGTISELIDEQLVVEHSADAFAFRHALTREAVYATMLKRERREVHRRIAEALECLEDGSHAAHLADLAYHCYQAGAWAKALSYTRRAGERAQALFAPREALEHFTHALDAARHLSIAPPFEILRTRAKAHEMLGDFEQARIDFEAALEIARTRGDLQGEWQATLDLGFLWSARDYARSGEYVLQALDLARRLGDPANLARTLNRVGNWHVNSDEPFEALPYHEQALHISQQLNDWHGVAQTLELLSMTSYVGANSLQGAAYCQQAIPLFREIGDREGLIRALAHLTPVQHDTEVTDPRDLATLAAPAQEALQLAREIGWPGGEAEALGAVGVCAWAIGDFAQALACARACLAIAEEGNHQFGLVMSHIMLGQVYLNLLAFSNVQAHFEQARVAAEACHSVVMIRFSTAQLAFACIAQGDLERAEALLSTVLADRVPRTRQLRVCWNGRAELALTQGDPAQALRIADELITSAPNIERYGARGIPRLSLLRGQALVAVGRMDEAQAALLDAREGAREQGRRPPVVLETGLGAESDEWERVQREVEQFTQVCRYDRANRGQSDPAPKPRSAHDCVEDLRALLIAAKLPAPYVLVGHSLGGIIVRLYAHHYPGEVAGLVLVDSAHENQFERMSPLISAKFPGEPESLTWFRDFWDSGWRDPSRNDEGIDFLATRAQAQAIGSLGDLPLLMLTAGSQINAAPPGNADAAHLQSLWEELHREIMQQSSDAQQTLVRSSGHFIQREQPEVIVAAIRQIVEKLRAQSPGVIAVAQPASDDGW